MMDDIPVLDNFFGPKLYDQYSEYDGWYCIQTAPYQCSCRLKLWTFLHFGRDIVVWEDKDDETILKAADELKKMEFDPCIIMYNAVMGQCVEWKEIPAGAEIG